MTKLNNKVEFLWFVSILMYIYKIISDDHLKHLPFIVKQVIFQYIIVANL